MFEPPRALTHLPRCELGEGPRWDQRSQRLYWVDIIGHEVHRWDPVAGQCETHDAGTHEAGSHVGFVALDDSDRLILGLRDGIYETAFGAREARLLARPDMDPGNRFNDGACDPRGRLWAGTMHVSASRDREPTGALYRLDAEGCTIVESDLGIANGLGWSPSGTTMYFSDSHGGVVWAYDYDLETGAATRRRPFAEVPIDVGVPDGLTVDAEGRVYVALWRGARLNIYAPDGALTGEVRLPVPHPTSCCFGDADLATLYITTSAEGLSADDRRRFPLSGFMFAQGGYAGGLPSTRLKTFD